MILLDTHILLFWFGDASRLSEKQREILETVSEDKPLLLSNMSLWEIATLYSLKRIALDLPIRDWFERAVATPRVQRISITPAIATEVATLPDSFHRDPGDRVIVATARVLGATLLTQDRKIIDAELVRTLS